MMKKFALATALFALTACAGVTSPTFGMMGRFGALYSSTPSGAGSIDGDSHGKFFYNLVRVASGANVDVVLTPGLVVNDHKVWGAYDHESRKIYIDSMLGPNARMATLAHELVHVFTQDLAAPDNDVVAEAVSYLYCQHVGLDIGRSSFGYLHGNREKVEAILQQHADRIDNLLKKFILESGS